MLLTETAQVALIEGFSADAAVMVQVPSPFAVTIPVLLTVATASLLLLQTTPLFCAVEGEIAAVRAEVSLIVLKERLVGLNEIPVTRSYKPSVSTDQEFSSAEASPLNLTVK